MVSEWNQIIGTVKAIGIWDILDIVIVALLIYQVIKLFGKPERCSWQRD